MPLAIFVAFGISTESNGNSALTSMLALAFVASLLPIPALVVRRFHDCGLSGKWLIAAGVSLLIPAANLIASLVLLAISLWPGGAEPNRFGPPPSDQG